MFCCLFLASVFPQSVLNSVRRCSGGKGKEEQPQIDNVSSVRRRNIRNEAKFLDPMHDTRCGYLILKYILNSEYTQYILKR